MVSPYKNSESNGKIMPTDDHLNHHLLITKTTIVGNKVPQLDLESWSNFSEIYHIFQQTVFLVHPVGKQITVIV